jgi:hypothetical protein
MDADAQGRAAAQRIAADLPNAEIVDLAPDRDDGYDLSDWLSEHRPHRDIRIEDIR